MKDYTLSAAIEYEAKAAADIRPEERPAYHFSPMVGWMNDPNGFSWYNGEYHLFYQYHPYKTAWNAMHWGHAVSKDLVHWTYLPAVMAPDQPYDKMGCFSGTATTAPDGKHLLIYTGVYLNEEGRECQHQCVAVGDGRTYTKYAGNPVISSDTLPEELSPYDFRDPKIFKTENGYRCVMGACTKAEHHGVIMQYESEDGLHWKPLGELARNSGEFGSMWECPDFFPLDGRQILSVSPQDMLPVEYKYACGNDTTFFVGDLNEDGTRFTFDKDQPVDYGPDFYAPQTMLTPDGRRVMIGWMQNWDSVSHGDEPNLKWHCQMTTVREIHVRDGQLIQQPIREMESLRKNHIAYKDIAIDGKCKLEGVRGRVAELLVTLKTGESACENFEIHVAENERFKTIIRYEPTAQLLTMDRTWSGTRRNFSHQRSCKVEPKNGEITLRILIDRFSVEVFAGEGEQAMTMAIRTEASADGISFHSNGKMKADIEKYDIVIGE